jgi:hypothetical protein
MLSKLRFATKVYQQAPYVDQVSIKQEFIYITVCLSTSLSMRLYFPSLLFAAYFDVVPRSVEEVSPW